MDFGIARNARAPAAAAQRVTSGHPLGSLPQSVEATIAGTVLGTVQYMAPEQAKGEVVDQRADIYAFGLIFSDILLGKRSKSAGSALEELEQRIVQAPPPIRSADPSIPEQIEQVISRCLEPDRALRFQTSAELVAALDRLDENGRPLPIAQRVTPRLVAATAVVVFALLGGTYFVTRRAVEPVAEHAPVSVLIADFANGTKDPSLDHTLEPTLKLALEGAGFISAYDRAGMTRGLGVQVSKTIDEMTAREIAVKQGVGIVVSGTINRRGNGYALSMKAIRTVTGDVITDVSATASNKDRVLGVTTELAGDIRRALGDDTSDSAQRFAMETLSAASLDVIHDYAVGMVALSDNRNEDARQNFMKAVQRDRNFGAAYAALAIASANIGQQQEAEQYVKEAVRHLDGMTERERYRTRGLFYYVTGDYQACVKEYSDLVARYSADAAAHNNLALCSTKLRNMTMALDEMRRVVDILPKRALYRVNLALYAAYGGDFQSGEQQALMAHELGGRFALPALAFAKLGQGAVVEANDLYGKIAKIDELGASQAASGLGDLAIYAGRYRDAVRVLSQGAAADLASRNPDRAAAKYALLAQAHALRLQRKDAVSAADRALAHSKAAKIRFLAARAFVEAGDTSRAKALSASLAS
jgi:eukaryotic-like serine/threonine-protein kinase